MLICTLFPGKPKKWNTSSTSIVKPAYQKMSWSKACPCSYDSRRWVVTHRNMAPDNHVIQNCADPSKLGAIHEHLSGRNICSFSLEVARLPVPTLSPSLPLMLSSLSSDPLLQSKAFESPHIINFPLISDSPGWQRLWGHPAKKASSNAPKKSVKDKPLKRSDGLDFSTQYVDRPSMARGETFPLISPFQLQQYTDLTLLHETAIRSNCSYQRARKGDQGWKPPPWIHWQALPGGLQTHTLPCGPCSSGLTLRAHSSVSLRSC